MILWLWKLVNNSWGPVGRFQKVIKFLLGPNDIVRLSEAFCEFWVNESAILEISNSSALGQNH